MTSALTQDVFVFVVDDMMYFNTIAYTKSGCKDIARLYFCPESKNWYDRGKVIPIRITQLAEYR